MNNECACWEARQHGVDLKDILSTIKSNAGKRAAKESADRPSAEAFSKKQGADASFPKKTKREVNLAEKKKKESYNAVPPAAFGAGKDKDNNGGCLYCFGGRGHADNPRDHCWVGGLG